jgi:UDP-GlcNAc3NAcA epimerase
MTICTIVGARPQFVKAAVVSRALRSIPGVREVLIHTGQHFDANMSQVFFDEMEIPKPDYNLGIGGGTHGQNTGRMIEEIEKVLLTEKPDWVLVYGDTDSTLAGALAAVKQHIPVAHVEAGLRSFNRQMPEEINRILTDHIADLLFAPTDVAVENLKKEGIAGASVIRTGDVMYDAALYYRKSTRRPDIPDLPESGFVLCTLHRAENTDDPARLASIMDALSSIAKEMPVVLPLHPRTRARLFSTSFSDHSLTPNNQRSTSNDQQPTPNHQPSTINHLLLSSPVGYFEMLWLLENCRLVMTDSGGVQKEAYFFQKPCVTLRDQTEWVELVDAGVNTLAGADSARILAAYAAMKTCSIPAPTLYGDGHSARKIVETLMRNG